jgi:hypothetical protein
MLPVARLDTPPRPEAVLRIVRRVFHGSEVHHVLRNPDGLEIEAATPSSATLSVGTEVIAHARAREVPVYPMPDAVPDQLAGPETARGGGRLAAVADAHEVEDLPPGVG